MDCRIILDQAIEAGPGPVLIARFWQRTSQPSVSSKESASLGDVLELAGLSGLEQVCFTSLQKLGLGICTSGEESTPSQVAGGNQGKDWV